MEKSLEIMMRGLWSFSSRFQEDHCVSELWQASVYCGKVKWCERGKNVKVKVCIPFLIFLRSPLFLAFYNVFYIECLYVNSSVRVFPKNSFISYFFWNYTRLETEIIETNEINKLQHFEIYRSLWLKKYTQFEILRPYQRIHLNRRNQFYTVPDSPGTQTQERATFQRNEEEIRRKIQDESK